MRRREPPPLATWMLEHMSAGDRDEALAGDLLEVFRTGRSEGWYWRQSLTACLVSWLEVLRARMPLLMFALLWSMLAPAWKVFADTVGGPRFSAEISGLPGPLPMLLAVIAWTVLHASFLWAGMLVYLLSQTDPGRHLRTTEFRRALLLAPLLFLPLIGAAFILMNLYSFPGLVNARLAATPLARIADLRMPADVLRLPYFLALVASLWETAPRAVRGATADSDESIPIEFSGQSSSNLLAPRLDPFSFRRFFAFVVVAGLLNAMIAGFLLCRLPDSHAPGLFSVLIRALVYVSIGAVAGVSGSWVYWRNPSSPFREHGPLPFLLFALVSAVGWVWVPAMVIFSEQLSTAACFVSMIAAFAMGSGLRTIVARFLEPAVLLTPRYDEGELFAESLYRAPLQPHGYIIALGLYAAGAALATHQNHTAAALLATSAFLFAWNRTLPRVTSRAAGSDFKKAALRLTRLAFAAVLVTTWALLDGVAHRNQAEQASASASRNGNRAGAEVGRVHAAQTALQGVGGYESVILWPYPEKKQIVPPVLREDSLLAPGTTRPLIIPFNGQYWFLQPPEAQPGPAAHQAHGTPVTVGLESNNSLPLVMDAHQYLSAPVKTARCREIDVEIENRDNRPGAISLAVLVTEDGSPSKATVYLGHQPIESTEPGNFVIKASPVFETLRFPFPANAELRKFNEITVLVLPDIEHRFVAPRIAIQRFELLPR